MPGHWKRQPVYDEYGELIGHIETSDASDDVRVLDADGYHIAATRSVTTGKRHLLNVAFNNKQYFTKPRGRR